MTTIEDLPVEKLRHILSQAVMSGLLDPVTFAPRLSVEDHFSEPVVSDFTEWHRVRIKRHVFDMPRSMTHPQFLGVGGYGCVAECWYGGQKVAVKKVPVPGRSRVDDVFRLLREVVILQKVQKEKHQCLTPLLGMYTNADCFNPRQLKYVYLVMPLYSPGCLEDVKVDTPEMFRTIASHTLEGLHWLHSHDLLHRDLKRENIFYDAARNRAVLGDLGSSRRCEKKMTGKNEVGTKCYLAPEFLASKEYSFASDVWSLGVCWYEMLCVEVGHDTMFPHGSEIKDSDRLAKQKAFCHLINPKDFGRRPPKSSADNITWAEMTWSRVDDIERKFDEEAYRRLFLQMFQFDQHKRILTDELYSDPFFADLIREDFFANPTLEGIDTADYDEARSHLFDLRSILPPPNMKSMSEPSLAVTLSTVCPSDIASIDDDRTKIGYSPFTDYDAESRCRAVQYGPASVSPVRGREGRLAHFPRVAKENSYPGDNLFDVSSAASLSTPLGRRTLCSVFTDTPVPAKDVQKKRTLLSHGSFHGGQRSPRKKSPRPC